MIYISSKEGDKKPYYQCLEYLKIKIEEQKDPVVLHTDQGSVSIPQKHLVKLIKIIK